MSAMPNELELDRPRQGSLIDFDENTPDLQVTLERTSEGIGIAVHWANPESPYAGWFSHGAELPGAAVARTVPKALLFHDSHGSVLLVDCWARGYHMNVFGPGTGYIWARYAVMGVHEDIDFLRPHGVRSEITALRAWMGVSSVIETHDFPTDGRQNSATIVSQNADPILTAQETGLRFVPTWRVERNEDNRTVFDQLIVETRTSDPGTWQEQLKHHLAMRDLLVISQWRAEVMTVTAALRDDDLVITGDGENHGPQWRAVVPAHGEEGPPKPSYRRHLITFSDIGIEGVERWLALRDEFARALDPIISTISMERVSAMTMLAQAGPGIEALGYLLLIRDGQSANAAGSASLRVRLSRIQRDVGSLLPFDADDWVVGTVEAYNGLKHANRTAPEELEMINRWRETVLVVRAWVARELGTTADHLRQRLTDDPQSHPWVPIS
jgi:hypothetical protein